MKKGDIYREKRLRPPMYDPRDVGIVTASDGHSLRIQTVQLLYGCWVRQKRARVKSITVAEFAQRFVPVAVAS